jgi:hypothetical protein
MGGLARPCETLSRLEIFKDQSISGVECMQGTGVRDRGAGKRGSSNVIGSGLGAAFKH